MPAKFNGNDADVINPLWLEYRGSVMTFDKLKTEVCRAPSFPT